MKKIIILLLTILIISMILVYPRASSFLSFFQQRSMTTVGTAIDAQPQQQKQANFTGSDTCLECHEDQHHLWKKSRHSKMIQDVRTTPEAVIADFSILPAEADFSKDEIHYTVGSKYKQRYMIRQDMAGNEDYRMANYQWNIELDRWFPYKTYKKKWYADFYPHENQKIPTSTLCDGCHFVGMMSKGKRIEPAIACESCHGPGSAHAKNPEDGNIYTASNNDPRKANEVCLQCHLRNRDKRLDVVNKEELYQKAVDYPLGYEPGRPLMKYKKPAPQHYGKKSGEFYANGVGKKSRMQGNDYVQSMMYKHGVTCINCHNPHSLNEISDNNTGNELCLNCHQFGAINGPHSEELSQHSHHKADSTGSLCVECHMPKVAKNTGKSPISVRTHVFGFIYPSDTRKYGVPNACNNCHNDKTLDWSESYLRKWGMMNW
ncbi:MAG: multiheme c-type cytochrome [Gammaproteobacteria bacterium]|nr:multiheme c-type cytochrome [Gammaproteobacteria bacterium]